MNGLIYQVQDLTKTYNGKPILRVDRIDVHQGEILALVGPSGAGKSTLLRLLNFLESPTAGRIHFHDVEFDADQSMSLQLRRRVTMVSQRPILLNRSVWDNVAYGLRLRGQRDAVDQINAALAQVGLAELARQRARTLSGGEAQRVALARAMVLEPDVLLLDEPTANLDPYNVGLIEDTVRQLNRKRGTTLVLVTHNAEVAGRCDRALILSDGRLS